MAKTRVATPKNASATRIPVDIIFIVDVTGSMGSYISQAKQFLTSSMKGIEAISPLLDNRYSLIVYRDHPPEDCTFASKILVNVDHTEALTKGMGDHNFRADGGGDTPESGLDGINDITKLKLRPGSMRYAFIVGDAPLHGTGGKACKCGLTPVKIKTVLEQCNVVLTGVNISNYSPTTTSFATVAQSVIQCDGKGVAAISTALDKICKNIVWAVSTVLPILKKDKYKPLSEIATQCESNIKDVTAAIESLNLLELTAAL